MMIDVTGQSFPELMRMTVLGPLGMTQSSYEQPLPPAMASNTAAGHYPNGKSVKGRWHLYPEMAAAGLWTTPTDLLRFAMEVQKSNAGQSNKVISQTMTREMLTEQKDMDGLGVFLEEKGGALKFGHGGRDEGFDANLLATVSSGQGVAIMINANDNSPAVSRITAFIARKYRWPTDDVAYVPPTPVKVTSAELEAVAGRYEMSNNNMASFIVQDGHVFRTSDDLPAEEFIPIGGGEFVSADRQARLKLQRDANNVVTGFAFTVPRGPRTVPRIGPLFSALVAKPDTDPALAARVEAVVRALGKGGDELASVAGISEGARKDFGRGAWQQAADVRRLSFITEDDVSGRKIERHGHPVARIRYYRMTTGDGDLNLMVHLTSDGLVTDVDVVGE
jgi:hypothetical protein